MMIDENRSRVQQLVAMLKESNSDRQRRATCRSFSTAFGALLRARLERALCILLCAEGELSDSLNLTPLHDDAPLSAQSHAC